MALQAKVTARKPVGIGGAPRGAGIIATGEGAATAARIASIDTFRGFAICAMVVAHCGFTGAVGSAVSGVSARLSAPFFCFSMGLAIPFLMRRRDASLDSQFLKGMSLRSVKLYLIGVVYTAFQNALTIAWGKAKLIWIGWSTLQFLSVALLLGVLLEFSGLTANLAAGLFCLFVGPRLYGADFLGPTFSHVLFGPRAFPLISPYLGMLFMGKLAGELLVRNTPPLRLAAWAAVPALLWLADVASGHNPGFSMRPTNNPTLSQGIELLTLAAVLLLAFHVVQDVFGRLRGTFLERLGRIALWAFLVQGLIIGSARIARLLDYHAALLAVILVSFILLVRTPWFSTHRVY